MELQDRGDRQAYTQVLLSSIFVHQYSVCHPVHPNVLRMAQGTHHCLDMPYGGARPDGGVDLYDYLHFLMVRSGHVEGGDVVYEDAKLLNANCSGGDVSESRRSLLGEHPESNWIISTSTCQSPLPSTCHYTCNADPTCHFTMRPVLESSTSAGSFKQIIAPAGGFRAMSLLFTEAVMQAPCQSESPSAYCYDTSNLALEGSCVRIAPQREPANPVESARLGLFVTNPGCVITGFFRFFSPDAAPVDVDFLHKSGSSPLPGTTIQTTVRHACALSVLLLACSRSRKCLSY